MGSSAVDSEAVTNVIYRAIDLHNEDAPPEQMLKKSPETKLYGGTGALDSLSLVTLIVTVEQSVAQEFGRSITIANEKAFSARNSPFRSIGTLSEFVKELLQETNHDS